MDNNLVSIITPLYNSEKYIEATIESIIKQTYQNWEMIIVDDCSKDNSVNIAEKYVKNDKRIKLIKQEKHNGAAISRNIAIERSKGRYIAFIDSDDIWLPDKLGKQIAFMKSNNYGFTYSYYQILKENGEITKNIIKPKLKVNYNDMLKKCEIGCLTVVYDTAFLGKQYMPLIKKRQDYGLWLKLLRNIKYAYCYPEILALYRIRENSISRNKISLIKYNYSIFRYYEKMSVIKSIYYLLNNIIYKIIESTRGLLKK